MSALRTQFMVCMETGNRLEVYYRTPGAQEWTSAYQTQRIKVFTGESV